MAMSGGSVTINSDGTRTGTGLSLALYDALVAKFGTIPAGAAGVPAKQQIADVADAFGPAIVTYVQANAQVTTSIAPADAGLQETPNPNTPATATLGPATTVVLSTKGTVG